MIYVNFTHGRHNISVKLEYKKSLEIHTTVMWNSIVIICGYWMKIHICDVKMYDLIDYLNPKYETISNNVKIVPSSSFTSKQKALAHG